MDLELLLGLFFIFLLIAIPIVAALLYAITLITTTITFNWLFVFIIGGLISLIGSFVFVLNKENE